MPFSTVNGHLQFVAQKSLLYCRTRYGANGLTLEKEIDKAIGWQPTFFLRPDRNLILAVEVDDNLYPEALKGAAYDIGNFDSPIAVYQACSLNAYQNDPKQLRVRLLRNHGFGIITVDANGDAVMQHPCIPLSQYISNDHLEKELGKLNHVLKVKFNGAHDTYLANPGQGLQQAGQIIEGLIYSLAKRAAANGIIQAGVLKDPLADIIDALYGTQPFKPHRAALGGAREFVKEFRNVASHAPRNAKQAAEKIRRCKTGFMDAINVAAKLRAVFQALGYSITIHVT